MKHPASLGRGIACMVMFVVIAIITGAGCIDAAHSMQGTVTPANPQSRNSAIPTTSIGMTKSAAAAPGITAPSGSPQPAAGVTTPVVLAQAGFLSRAGSSMRADDFFRQYLSGILFIQNRWLEYRYTYTEDYFNETWLNSSWAYTFRAAGVPGTCQGKPAVHYSETICSSYSLTESPLQPQIIDVYYDPDTGVTLGEAVTNTIDTGGVGQTTVSPGGANLTDCTSFYAYFEKNDLYLEPGMLGQPGTHIEPDARVAFVGNETITIPAGTFDTTSHFTEHHMYCGLGGTCGNYTEDFWTAPGVPGFIRIRYESNGPGPRAGSYYVSERTAELSGQG